MESNLVDENSTDGNLKPKKRIKIELEAVDENFIEYIEKDVKENLEGSVIKEEVFIKEDILAENLDDSELLHEPLYIKTETKPLLSIKIEPNNLSWASPPKTELEVDMLCKEELQEHFEQPPEVNVVLGVENEQSILISEDQIPILAQQMRQHVQMLTHNFLLAYENPEFSDLAMKFKKMLINIKMESEGKKASIYHAMNLNGAIELIENWEQLFATSSKEVLECKEYVEKVMAESIQARGTGTTYIVTFPPLLLKTISNSKVFIYPNLLPRIPFRSTKVTRTAYYFFTHSEENLMALFIEQALYYLKNDPFHLTKWKKVNMEHVWHLIHILLMPHVSPSKMRQHVIKRKRPTSEENPIKYFYRTKKAPPVVHYVTPLDENSIVPPCKRSVESLPYQWREYLYPNYQTPSNKQTILLILPNVPSIGVTSVKHTENYIENKNNLDPRQTISKRNDVNGSSKKEQNCFEGIRECCSSSQNETTTSTAVNNSTTTVTEKDNLDIHEVTIANSAVKSVPKKEPSSPENKRAKLREFIANLVMATPEDSEVQNQKTEIFADSLFHKLDQTLITDDYNKIIDILGHHNESSNGDLVGLYKNVQSVLFPTYKELAEEFLLFLTSIQAHKVGQLMPYFMLNDMDRFMKKLQIYFKDQPSQMKKIIKCLTDLSQNRNLTIETIKTTILPLFKGNAALPEWFLPLFPYETLPNL